MEPIPYRKQSVRADANKSVMRTGAVPESHGILFDINYEKCRCVNVVASCK